MTFNLEVAQVNSNEHLLDFSIRHQAWVFITRYSDAEVYWWCPYRSFSNNKMHIKIRSKVLTCIIYLYKHFNIGSRRESGTSERRRLPSPPQSTGHQLLVLSDLHLTPHIFEPTLHSLKIIKIYRFRYIECDDTAIQSIPVMG